MSKTGWLGLGSISNRPLPGRWYSPVGVNDPFTRWPCRDLAVTGARHYPETGWRYHGDGLINFEGDNPC